MPTVQKNKITLNIKFFEINSNRKKYLGPNANNEIHTVSKIEPKLSPIPVILWKIEKIDVNSFLWILKCGDKGLLSIIKIRAKINYYYFKYLFFT